MEISAKRRQQLRAANKRSLAKTYILRRIWRDGLKSGACTDCGGKFPPCCMDWDHRDPATKLGNVGWMTRSAKHVVLAEIAKCDLVCANCHRIRTSNRKRN